MTTARMTRPKKYIERTGRELGLKRDVTGKIVGS
jgi:hypothetical protein